jgi:hypothetical protein
MLSWARQASTVCYYQYLQFQNCGLIYKIERFYTLKCRTKYTGRIYGNTLEKESTSIWERSQILWSDSPECNTILQLQLTFYCHINRSSAALLVTISANTTSPQAKRHLWRTPSEIASSGKTISLVDRVIKTHTHTRVARFLYISRYVLQV